MMKVSVMFIILDFADWGLQVKRRCRGGYDLPRRSRQIVGERLVVGIAAGNEPGGVAIDGVVIAGPNSRVIIGIQAIDKTIPLGMLGAGMRLRHSTPQANQGGGQQWQEDGAPRMAG